jgi:hypothetical protein
MVHDPLRSFEARARLRRLLAADNDGIFQGATGSAPEPISSPDSFASISRSNRRARPNSPNI